MSPAVARSPQHEAVHESDGLKSVPRYVSFSCYQMGTKGLFKNDGDDEQMGSEGEENAKSLFISGPFEVLGRARNPNGEGWGRVLGWSDDDKRPHTAIILDADLHGDPSALCADLASRGLKVATGRTARVHLIAYLNEIPVVDRVTIVERTGWHEVSNRKVFVLPDNPIGLIENESFIIQNSTTAPFVTRGTLADWQRGVGSLVAGHSRAVFAVSLGFAGPLLGARTGGRRFQFVRAIEPRKDDVSKSGSVCLGEGRQSGVCSVVALNGKRPRSYGGVTYRHAPCA
jgi:putative DNA primase/helicase